ncbi:hypothetical protein [Chromobacterium vaccinii]|nr:hypothetical protein [Chromobacterium vaccinii]QND86377.1 Uncharacterized protein ChrSW_4151 [Chromobacterium vaccinii]QND91608.1 Uncharacterized protein ChrSV_4151 [Chromobacterium vaccinii]SUX53848.1 Uncharacterised protein [Chromobacterium vaccinii]
MSQHGFMVRNGNGGIVVSDRTYSLVFAGVAQFNAVTGTPSGIVPQWYDFMKALYTLRYYVSCPYEPLPFIRRSGGWAGIVGVQGAGPGRWEITLAVYPNHQPQVLVFCRTPNTVAGRWGMVLRREDGSICYDSNQRNLVLMDAVVHTPSNIHIIKQVKGGTPGRRADGTFTPVRWNSPNAAYCYSINGKYISDFGYYSYYDLLNGFLEDGGFRTDFCHLARGGQDGGDAMDCISQTVMITDASLYV